MLANRDTSIDFIFKLDAWHDIHACGALKLLKVHGKATRKKAKLVKNAPFSAKISRKRHFLCYFFHNIDFIDLIDAKTETGKPENRDFLAKKRVTETGGFRI